MSRVELGGQQDPKGPTGPGRGVAGTVDSSEAELQPAVGLVAHPGLSQPDPGCCEEDGRDCLGGLGGLCRVRHPSR